MKKLAFDIDGTLANIITPLRQRMWRDWHVDIDEVGVGRHDFFEQICQPGYFLQFLDYFYSILEHHWMGIDPYDGTEVLFDFEPVVFITARKEYLIPATRDWIEYNYPSLIYTIHQARSKDKAHLLLELGMEGIVEDRLQTANQVAEIGMMCYLLNRSWNVDRPTHPNVIRVDSLSEILTKENANGKEEK